MIALPSDGQDQGVGKTESCYSGSQASSQAEKDQKQKIQDLMKQAQKVGLKPEEIAERLGLTIQD